MKLKVWAMVEDMVDDAVTPSALQRAVGVDWRRSQMRWIPVVFARARGN